MPKWLLAVLALALARPAFADRPSAVALPRHGTATVDGRLDDAAWDRAKAAGGFIERKPGLGETPADATHFQALCDNDALWIAVWCDDGHPDEIRARTTARDTFALFADDAISVKIDALLDLRSTLGFAMNPAGARLDYRGLDEADMKLEADTVWQGAAARTPTGWTAEFRIPWTSLGLNPAALPAQIGLNFSRDHSRRNATYDWALMPAPYTPVSASLYGRLTGIAQAASHGDKGIGDSAALPGEATGTSEATSLWIPYALGGILRDSSGVQPDWNLGGDWSGQLGKRWKGHVTVNTDFAQADTDDRVVNLTRFSLYMPEKRDFFLRDVDLFSLGRSRSAQLFYSRTIGIRDGVRVPLAGGFKLTGAVGDSARVGAMEMVTGTPRDPEAVLGVARLVGNLGGGSKFGGMVTHRIAKGAANIAAGLDGTLRAAGSRFLAETYAMASADNGSAGSSGGVDAQWRGALVRPKLSYYFADSRFNPALGFVQRTGVHDLSASVQVEPRIGKAGLEKFNCDTKLRGIAGFSSGQLLDRSWGGGCNVIWQSGWTVGAGGELSAVTVSAPFSYANHTDIAAGRYSSSGGGIEFGSPDVEDFVVSFGIGRSNTFGGTDSAAGGGLTWRAGKRLRVETGADVHHVVMETAARSFDSLTWNSRIAIGISPELNADVYAGWNRLANQLLTNARVRWTWRPASDLFVVWQEDLVAGPWKSNSRSLLAKVTWAVF